MFIRQERSFGSGSLIAATAIDTTTYDKAGRYNGVQATVCPNNAIPQFIFSESADSGDPVPVAFIGMPGLVTLKMKGTGTKGNKVITDSSGNFVASGTADNAALGTWDFGIAKTDWTDGQEINVMIMRGGI